MINKINTKIKQIPLRLIDVGLVKGNSNYCKFLIVTQPRSGSNLLFSYLNSVSDCVIFHELFSKTEKYIKWYSSRSSIYYQYEKQEQIIYLRDNDPVSFVKKYVFRPYTCNIKCVGFKLFYDHARDSNSSGLWNYLADDQYLHIIHLKRKNLLEQYLSLQKAINKGVWIQKDNKRIEKFCTTIKKENLEHYFVQTESYQKQIDQIFAKQDKLEMYYEDLVEDRLNQLTRLKKFLNLPLSIEMQSDLQKQNMSSLKDQILNYYELKFYFKSSRFENFFLE